MRSYRPRTLCAVINSARQYPVHMLLSDESNVEYRVPKFQREYSWQRQQWETLFDDLVESETAHFLGTIITLNNSTDSTDRVVLEVIDGQQRLTTITLLLAAIYSKLAEDRSTDDESVARRVKLAQRLARGNEPRLIPQSQGDNSADYRTALAEAGLKVRAEKRGWYGLRKISRCVDHFRNSIDQLARQRDEPVGDTAADMLDRVLRAIIVKIEVASHADAFVLFESLNNRGMPLTPVDLIKNHILAEAEKRDLLSVDEAFDLWQRVLSNLGSDATTHERFLRYFYNAFKPSLPAVERASTATRSNLIRIYESMLRDKFIEVLERLVEASAIYGRIIGLNDDARTGQLDIALDALMRAQGSPSHVLLLALMRDADTLGLDDRELTRITARLTAFFLRRNLSGTPQTYALQTLFMSLVELSHQHSGSAIETAVAARLREISVSDAAFLDLLRGPLYDMNTDMARFALIALEEARSTKESKRDFWMREGKRYAWTLEHVFPQGTNLPTSWQEMMGGPEQAAEVQERLVHQLGNLTLTRYNSNLSNFAFIEKRDREENGNPIGYRNGLWLNSDLAQRDAWNADDIRSRTDELSDLVLELFPL